MLVKKEAIVTQIYEDWGDNPQSKICVALLDYLLHIPVDRPSHITYGSLKLVVDEKYTDSELLKAIQYLCGDRTNLLETNFELIENDEESSPISKAEINLAQKIGELIHPETGKLVNNFKEKVFMYFQPSSLVKKIIQ